MDEGFVRRTYRSVAFVTAFVLFVLASYGQFWALLPTLAGALFGALLLYGMEVFVRGTFTPERAQEARKRPTAKGPRRALLGLALVKYPLIALALWAATRAWGEREIVAFAGGFTLIPVVIGLRGAGRLLTDRENKDASRGKE